MKYILLLLALFLGLRQINAQQITYMSKTRESQLEWRGWTSGRGYHGQIKVAIPGANFTIDTTYQDMPYVTFGMVDWYPWSWTSPPNSYPVRNYIFRSHAALPYSSFNPVEQLSGSNYQLVPYYVKTPHPDTLIIFTSPWYDFGPPYGSGDWGSFSPLKGTFDLEVRHHGRRFVKDSAFTFDGFKEPTETWAYNRNADRISMHGLEGRAGQVLDVEITGIGTHFTQASFTINQVSSTIYTGLAPNELIVNFYNDTSYNTINEVSVISPTRMVASITVPPSTPPGLYDVVLVTPQDGFKHINNGFRVLPGVIDEPAHIKGMVYNDENRNCVPDSGDYALEGIVVKASPGDHLAITNSSGMYDIQVPYGNYSVTRRSRAGFEAFCQQHSDSVRLTVTAPMVEDVSFADSLHAYRDLSVYGYTSTRARPGFPLTLTGAVKNEGNVRASGKLRFIADPILDSITAQLPAADQIRADTLLYNVVLEAGQYMEFTIRTHVPATVPLGTNLHSWFDLLLSVQDEDESNNYSNIATEVRGSFDPNDKAVEPAGDLTPADSVLTYTIRFQNSGTDTAFTVVVRDTLSANLDVASIKTLVASHPYRFSLKGTHNAEWRFDNILLPDSNVNEEQSHGLIRFSINRKKGLAPGTAIENTGHIYFDFNPDAETNLVRNTIATVTATQPVHRSAIIGNAMVVPNPVHGTGKVVLQETAKGNAVMTITDALGQKAYLAKGLFGKEVEFPKLFKPGIYFLLIQEDGKTIANIHFSAQ